MGGVGGEEGGGFLGGGVEVGDGFEGVYDEEDVAD